MKNIRKKEEIRSKKRRRKRKMTKRKWQSKSIGREKVQAMLQNKIVANKAKVKRR
jgi:hypothetical protein